MKQATTTIISGETERKKKEAEHPLVAIFKERKNNIGPISLIL